MWSSPSSPTSPHHPAHHRHMSLSQQDASAKDTYRLKNQGKRVAQIVRLKKDCVEKYKECHAKVWPEVLKQIKECGIEDYSIFHDAESGILFASFKYIGYDYAGDMKKMRENTKVQEWWKMTDSYQETLVPGAKSSYGGEGEPGWWKGIEEVFYNP